MKMSHRIGLASVAITGVVVLAAAPANAGGKGGSVHVVRPGHSIQRAVDHARPGDTIVLKAGTYAGGILISTNGITIRGAGRKTVLVPKGENHCASMDDGSEESGICVLDPAMKHTIKHVTIKNLTVKGFDGFGIVGFGTDKLTVKGVYALDNEEYGITEFGSTRGAFIGNYVAGSSGEAGLYVGDIADAEGTIVKYNTSIDNALGILVRHARNVYVSDNTFSGNCAGVALVNDGQEGGQGNTYVTDNTIHANNNFCAAVPNEAPALQGTGVLIFGGDHNVIRDNLIIRNRGNEEVSGGVVLTDGSMHNKITDNVIRANRPADIVNNSGNDTNVFKRNNCKSSDPNGLCSHGHDAR
jgi:nitrous oxidase accessory protein NosD